MQFVLGHDEVKELFRRTLRRGRLASTYLLVGPPGVGKRSFAGALARALLCERDDRPDPIVACGECESCTLASGGAHPDLLRVAKPEGRSQLPLDLLIGPPDKRHRMGLCHDIALRPFRGRRRVAILEDADDLGVEAANSLLKTLEEPPLGSVLLLLGTSRSKQLPTIRSRAQVVRMGPLSEEQVAEALVRKGIESDEAHRLAAASFGSVTRAVALVDGHGAEAARAVCECLAPATIDPIRLATTLDQQSKAAGTEPRERRRLIADMIAAAVGVFRERLTDRAAAGAPIDATLEALHACFEAEEAIARNANQGAVVQRLAEQLARVSAG